MKTVPFLLLAVVISISCTVYARTWYITPDGTGDAPTIQAGIDSAAAGDWVALAEGVFRGEGNRDISFRGKAISVGGATEASGYVIDCEGSVSEYHRAFVFENGEGPTSILGVVKVINGFADGGGAVRITDGSPTVVDCIFSHNHSIADGGAIDATEFTVRYSSFSGNSADGRGGAVFARCEVAVTNCGFSANTAYEGGAIAVGDPACETHNLFYLAACVFGGNEAVLNGSAIAACGGNARLSIHTCTLSQNAVTGSGGAAIGMGSWSEVEMAELAIGSCTVVGNSGGIEDISSVEPVITQTIIAYNTWAVEGCAQLECSDIYGNSSGDWVGCIADQCDVNGNFSASPGFCELYWRFDLCDQSPCSFGNHPYGYDCGDIGANSVGCVCDPTQAEPTTWGAIKSVYR